MATNYPTFQSDPRLNSVSASLATITTVTASVISASSYAGIPVGAGGVTSVTAGTNITSSGASTTPTISLTSSITGGLTNISGTTTITSVSGNYTVLTGSSLSSSNYLGLTGSSVNFPNFTSDVRNQLSAGSNIGYGAGVISLNSSVSTTAVSGTTGLSGALGLFNALSASTGVSSSLGLFNAISSSVSGTLGLFTAVTASNISSSGNISLGGNITLSNAGGIIFGTTANAPSGTLSSNTISDYEIGTWTPSFEGTGWAYNVSATNGRYTKIGNMVYVDCQITVTTVGTSGLGIRVNGLPFTSNSTQTGMFVIDRYANLAAGIASYPVGYVQPNTNYADINKAASATSISLQTADLTSTSIIRFTGVYAASS